MLGAILQWRAWASRRRQRRARLDRARAGSGMALLRPRAGGPVTAAPVPVRHTTCATHLHLAAGPVAPGRPGGRGRPGPGGGAGPPGRKTVLERVLARPRPAPPAGRRTGDAGGQAGARPSALAAMAPRPAVLARHPGPGAASRPAVVPVRRVTDELVARVVHAHQRIELPAHRAAMMRERAGVAAAVERALAAAGRRPAGAPADQPPAGTAWPAAASPGGPPPLDLEHLTDQIVTRLDHRLTAHRERFGRAV
jgi:hypothetical protein